MTDIPLIEGPVLPPRSGNKPKQLILILHGWGADGANLIDIGEVLAQAFPDAQFMAPNGPEVCEVNPYGFQWFSLMNRDPQVMLQGTRNAEKSLNRFIDHHLKQTGLGADKLAMVGFSQGTMTGLHTVLRRKQPPACMVGFSGALIGAEVLPDEIISKPPICLIHGERDDVVPFTSMAKAVTALKNAGVNVESHARPGLVHSIDMPGITAAAEFLKKHLI